VSGPPRRRVNGEGSAYDLAAYVDLLRTEVGNSR
jgi:hypothetical protein